MHLIDYNPEIHVSGCFIEIDRRLLLLQHTISKMDGDAWGIPGGKVESNETPKQGALRELEEETGICIELDAQISIFGTLYMRRPKIDLIFYLFKVQLDKLNLMPGGMEVLQKYYRFHQAPYTDINLSFEAILFINQIGCHFHFRINPF